MKKILLVIGIVLILIALPVTVLLVKQRQEIRQRAVAATTLYIEPPEVTKNVNDTFTLNVQAETGVNYLGALKLGISVNPQYLEIVSLQAGSFMPVTQLEPQISDGNASITVSVSHQPGVPANGAHGSGTVAVITVKALAPTEPSTFTEVRIAPEPDTFGSGTIEEDPATYEEDINVILSRQHGKVFILAAEASASPSPEPTVTPSPAASTSPQPSSTPGAGSASPTPSPSSSTQVTKITSPANGSTISTKRPTITGTTFNDGLVILSITQGQTTVATNTFYANAQGAWSYATTTDLANGTYTVTVTGDDPNSDTTETASSTFTVSVGGTGGSNASPSPSASATPGASVASASPATDSGVPVTGTATPTLFILAIGLLMLLFGAGAAFISK